MAEYPEKYCDVVMKGGITSGIVYPNAVLELAKEYRFKNIGGTSAGAIAAAVTAAAALGDRNRHGDGGSGQGSGFEGMRGVAKLLSRQGFIYQLFQPVAGACNAFRLLVLLAGPGSWWRKLLGVAIAVIAIAPLELLAILALLCGLGYAMSGWSGAKAALVPALFCAYGGGATFAVLRVARVARGNLMGLCSGLRGARVWPWWRGQPPALTEWLHAVLQDMSGKPADEPLTFGDLRNAPRYGKEPGPDFAINLQMITTGVSHREPRTLPFANKAFWFLEKEFLRLFPKDVVAWMIAHGGGSIEVDGNTYHRLPEGDQFPVLVATRMSLSFPLLISAVPLHEPCAWTREAPTDAEGGEGGAEEQTGEVQLSVVDTMEGLAGGGGSRASEVAAMRVCWFSDGGISSNFPVHLFDAGLPQWPTFAINLVYPTKKDADRPQSAKAPQPDELQQAVFLPRSNNQGWKVAYQPIAATWAIKEVLGFVFGIIGTMQNWRDLLQARAPGYRDRIVHVSLQGTEGGMNLNMPQEVLNRISAKGAIAGQRFAEFSFANHYWVRWRNLSAALQRYTVEFADQTDPDRGVPAYAEAYALPTGAGAPPSYVLRSSAASQAAQAMYAQLRAQGVQWKQGPALSDSAPRPTPQLRITPTF